MNNRIGGGKPRPLRLPCVRFCARQFNCLSATARIGCGYCSIPSVRADCSLLTMLALDLRPHVPTGFHIPPSVERIFRYAQLHKIPYSLFRNFPLASDIGAESLPLDFQSTLKISLCAFQAPLCCSRTLCHTMLPSYSRPYAAL